MTVASLRSHPGQLPALTLQTLGTVLLAGAAGTVAFDFLGQVLSPLMKSIASPVLGAKLAPVPLASAVLSKLTGIPGKELGALGLPYALHLLAGLIAGELSAAQVQEMPSLYGRLILYSLGAAAGLLLLLPLLGRWIRAGEKSPAYARGGN